MTGGEDKEGHVVTFKTWIRNTYKQHGFFIFAQICDRSGDRVGEVGGARTKTKTKTTNSKISSCQLTFASNLFVYVCLYSEEKQKSKLLLF